MKERPILFSGEMIRAILEGRKIQTRRVIKPQPPSIELVRDKTGAGYSINPPGIYSKVGWWIAGAVGVVCDLIGVKNDYKWKCPYGKVGDRLWVRETWALYVPKTSIWEEGTHKLYNRKFNMKIKPKFEHIINYRADSADTDNVYSLWKPSIFLPRWASRINLEVTGIRVERVQDISEADALFEGVEPKYHSDLEMLTESPYRSNFKHLWDSINSKRGYGWTENPWVWVVEFRKVTS